MSIPSRWRRPGQAVFVVGVALVLGVNWRADYESCRLCRALREVRTTSFVTWPLWREVIPSKPGSAGPGHRHDWWRYSRHYRNGLGGCLGGGIRCHTAGRYEDERGTPPSPRGVTGPP